MKRLRAAVRRASESRARLAKVAVIYGGAGLVGYAGQMLGIPIHWLIGPMLFAMAVSLAGYSVPVKASIRPYCQLFIGCAVGMAFTPAALASVSEHLWVCVAAALLTLVAGMIAAIVFLRTTRIDAVSASLSSIPGGPVEMANLAAQYGAAPGPVAFAQILRIAVLVLVIPLSMALLVPTHVAIDPSSRSVSTDYAGVVLLIAISLPGAWLFARIRMFNPFFLGPLAFTAIASSLSLPVDMPPAWLLAVAQLVMGLWLGSMFDRQMIAQARGFMWATFVSTATLVGLCVAMAVGIGRAAGIDWHTMVLATAPGGATEMVLTARALDQDVMLITAFHVIRLMIILPLVPLIVALIARLDKRLRERSQT